MTNPSFTTRLGRNRQALTEAGEPTEAAYRLAFEQMIDPTPLSARRSAPMPVSRAAICDALADCDTRAPRWVCDELALPRRATYADAVAAFRSC